MQTFSNCHSYNQLMSGWNSGSMIQVEVFKTNVQSLKEVRYWMQVLNTNFPCYQINFDLEDCDKILRVECTGKRIDVQTILKLFRGEGVEIEVLED